MLLAFLFSVALAAADPNETSKGPLPVVLPQTAVKNVTGPTLLAPAQPLATAPPEETPVGAATTASERTAAAEGVRFDGNVERAKAPDDGLGDWIAVERGRATQWLFENLQPAGVPSGVAQASPQRADPDYGYDWRRDKWLSLKVVANLYRKKLRALRKTKNPARRAQLQKEKDYYFQVLWQAAEREREYLRQGSPGEPKFNLDGTLFTGPWGRMQNDGPGTCVIALVHFAETLLMEGRRDLVDQLLYREELPAETVSKIHLEYLAHHWKDGSFDAWEEVKTEKDSEERFGSHFFNAMMQRRAFIDGARFIRLIDDGKKGDFYEKAAVFYELQAKALEPVIERHWIEELGIIVPTINRDGKPGRDGGRDDKREQLDGIIMLAINRGYVGDGFFGPTDDRVLATLHRIRQRNREIYPINQRPDIPGVGIGRYPEDVFFNGNPWFIMTQGLGESYDYAAKEFKELGKIEITPRNLAFFQSLFRELELSGLEKLAPGATFKRRSRMFRRAVAGLHVWADAQIQRVRFHANREDGSWSEQFDKNHGYQLSARNLMWNAAEFLRELDNREEAGDVDLAPLRRLPKKKAPPQP